VADVPVFVVVVGVGELPPPPLQPAKSATRSAPAAKGTFFMPASCARRMMPR
jgi:hypothetical protein